MRYQSNWGLWQIINIFLLHGRSQNARFYNKSYIKMSQKFYFKYQINESDEVLKVNWKRPKIK